MHDRELRLLTATLVAMSDAVFDGNAKSGKSGETFVDGGRGKGKV